MEVDNSSRIFLRSKKPSKGVCPVFLCPSCGNNDVSVDIETHSYARITPGMIEPDDSCLEVQDKIYIFECNQCGHYLDAYNLESLIEELAAKKGY